MTASPNTKRRLLFVDDETMLLDLYRAVFEDDQERWEISFAPSGAAALELMREQPVDVLVSDMRMPGMSGAELVLEVMRRYPKTSRLIMSGYADSEQIAQCLGATHQFIAKPFELSLLRSTITRVCSLDSWLLDDRLRTLVAQMRSLPSVPTLYFRIMEALASPDTTIERIGEIIASDPSMTAKILQLVNSAFFGIARRVSHPADAVQFLGVGRVRSLVLSLHVFSCFQPAHEGTFSIERVWKHSMMTALVAQKIARLQRADRAFLDETYVAGMLHDIGKVMLAVSLPELYDRAVHLAAEKKITLVEAEIETFGVSHAQVGAYLLSLWGLPITIVEAVAFHHTPQASAVQSFSPLTAVHVASVLEQQLQAAPAPEPPADEPKAAATPSSIDLEYLAALGLAARLEDWRDAAEEALANGG
jgi:putative nucleotidyltransferase with HDIG domain